MFRDVDVDISVLLSLQKARRASRRGLYTYRMRAKRARGVERGGERGQARGMYGGKTGV